MKTWLLFACAVAVFGLAKSENCSTTGLDCTHVVCDMHSEKSCYDGICTCRDITPGQYCNHAHECHNFFGQECNSHGTHWVCSHNDNRCHCYHGHTEVG